jgi:uncharacterized protein YajQ (UPF0234 family)
MTKKVKDNSDKQPVKMFGVMISSMPSLMFRMAGMFLRFRKEAQKGGKIFKKELIKQGIDKDTAEELTKIYIESSKLSSFFHN